MSLGHNELSCWIFGINQEKLCSPYIVPYSYKMLRYMGSISHPTLHKIENCRIKIEDRRVVYTGFFLKSRHQECLNFIMGILIHEKAVFILKKVMVVCVHLFDVTSLDYLMAQVHTRTECLSHLICTIKIFISTLNLVPGLYDCWCVPVPDFNHE